MACAPEHSCESDIESFDLNKLFDMEKVCDNVKKTLTAKRNARKVHEKNSRSGEIKSKEERKEGKKEMVRNPNQMNDTNSSFGLFEEKKSVHKRRKAKEVNKIARRNKKDESFGLEMLFGEKNYSERKNKRKDRKRRMMNSDDSDTAVNGKKEVKLKNKRPNYFVAIRVSDPKIQQAVKHFQDAVLKENEKLQPALIPVVSLHITMAVMHLDETQISFAQNSLDKCKVEIMEALKTINFKLTFHGVGNFNNAVVFAKVAEADQTECLKNINSTITAAFEEDGISLSDKKDWKPHLTLLKLSRKRSLKKSGIKKIEEDVYAKWNECNFGDEYVQNVHLCSMQGVKEHDGFYKRVSTIALTSVVKMTCKTHENDEDTNIDRQTPIFPMLHHFIPVSNPP